MGEDPAVRGAVLAPGTGEIVLTSGTAPGTTAAPTGIVMKIASGIEGARMVQGGAPRLIGAEVGIATEETVMAIGIATGPLGGTWADTGPLGEAQIGTAEGTATVEVEVAGMAMDADTDQGVALARGHPVPGKEEDATASPDLKRSGLGGAMHLLGRLNQAQLFPNTPPPRALLCPPRWRCSSQASPRTTRSHSNQ